MICHRGDNGAFSIGRDFERGLDASVSVVVGWRPDAPIGEVGWRWGVRVSWNWLPDRIYRTYDNATWLVGFGRWRRSFECWHIKPTPPTQARKST